MKNRIPPHAEKPSAKKKPANTSLINDELDRYLKVAKEDIMRVAKKYFHKDNRVVLYYLPKEEG